MADLSVNLPKQDGKYDNNGKYSWFGYSIRGSSHIAAETPCQDYNNFEYLKDYDVLIACIADGVGSCPLSHWGAYTAVETALKFVKEKLKEICHGRTMSVSEHRNAIPSILNEAFQSSLDAVEDFAVKNSRPVSAFFSTLTFALYDGERLYCEHAGDDGVVAQFMNGDVEMVTERIKGEEASSVYPLQSGPNAWRYSESGFDERGPVVAFTMVTDGVLDKFVFENDIYRQTEGCCSGVYYPFMAPMVYGDSRAGIYADDSGQKMEYFLQKMNNENYRRLITDDITLVSAVNSVLTKKSKKPNFDIKAFNEASHYIKEQQMKTLYAPQVETDVTRETAETAESSENDGVEPHYEKNEESREGESEVNQPINNVTQSDNVCRREAGSDGNSFFTLDFNENEDILTYIKRNKYLLLGIAAVILAFGLLLGILAVNIAGKINKDNDEPIQSEEEETAQPLYDEREDPLIEDEPEETASPSNDNDEKETEQDEQPDGPMGEIWKKGQNDEGTNDDGTFSSPPTEPEQRDDFRKTEQGMPR